MNQLCDVNYYHKYHNWVLMCKLRKSNGRVSKLKNHYHNRVHHKDKYCHPEYDGHLNYKLGMLLLSHCKLRKSNGSLYIINYLFHHHNTYLSICNYFHLMFDVLLNYSSHNSLTVLDIDFDKCNHIDY